MEAEKFYSALLQDPRKTIKLFATVYCIADLGFWERIHVYVHVNKNNFKADFNLVYVKIPLKILKKPWPLLINWSSVVVIAA